MTLPSSKSSPIPTQVWAFLRYFIKRHKRYYIPMMVAILSYPIYAALFPHMTKWLINSVVDWKTNDDGLSIWQVVAYPFQGIVGSVLMVAIGVSTYYLIAMYAEPKFRNDVHKQVLGYVKDHSLAYFADQLSGKMATRIHELRKSSQNFITTFMWLIARFFAFLLSVASLAYVNGVFGLVMFIWGIFHITTIFFFMDEIQKTSKAHSEKAMSLNGQVIDLISNMIVVRLFASEGRSLSEVEKYRQEELIASEQASWAYQKSLLICSTAWVTFITVMIYILVKSAASEWITMGDFPLVGMACLSMSRVIWGMNAQLSQLVKLYGVLDDGLVLLRAPHSVQDSPNAIKLLLKKGQITFDRVTFAYRQKKPLFKALSQTIKAGEKVGLVGFSGSGKTTFVNLLLRFFDIQEGTIKIDGQNIHEVTQASLRSQIAMIPQECTLFHRTIFENIQYGDPTATREEVENAAKMAYCDEFINALDDGYDTMVGEKGSKISGGQRQRIAIARAILKKAPILLLDEATSALDTITEQYIQTSLEQLMENRTTIVVAHRLSTLAKMDRIIVFDKGIIVEEGTHKELVNKKGHFARLWKLQVGGFLPDEKDNPITH